jgi:integrase
MYVQEMKTKKWKTIELSDELHERLEQYKPRSYTDRQRWLFQSPRDPAKHLHRSTVNRRLERVCKALDVDIYSPHSTRKLYAWHTWQKTHDIFAVQENLNHKYVADTCRYVDIDYEAMIKHAANAILSQRN